MAAAPLKGALAFYDRWEPHEEAALAHLWGRVPAVEIAVSLGRSVGACESRASELGLKSALSQAARQHCYRGNDFYLALLEEARWRTPRQIAKARGAEYATVKTWLRRARLYKARGKLG